MKLHALAVATMLLSLLFAGCTTTRFKHSGLSETLTSNKLLKDTAASAGAKIVEDSLQDGGTHGRNVEFERSFEVMLGTEPAGKVLSRFRTEALNHIFATGGIVHSGGQVVPGDAQLRDFHYRYRWANNQGLIRVYSTKMATNQLRVIVFCYEHPQ